MGERYADIEATKFSTGKPLVGVEIKIISTDGELRSRFADNGSIPALNKMSDSFKRW